MRPRPITTMALTALSRSRNRPITRDGRIYGLDVRRMHTANNRPAISMPTAVMPVPPYWLFVIAIVGYLVGLIVWSFRPGAPRWVWALRQSMFVFAGCV